MKKLNLGIHVAGEARKLKLNELEEMRLYAYNNAKISKERIKVAWFKHL